MTGIEWTERVWNPTTGCDRVSLGCDHCYAMTMAKRLKGMGQVKYQTDGDPKTSGPGFGIATHDSALYLPLKWRRPQRVFVNSMSDLFHKDVQDEFIARVWAVMAQAPQHTFQILTKRHARMRSLLNSPDFYRSVRSVLRGSGWGEMEAFGTVLFPLPNVHLGVSAEDQQWADIRIPALLGTPAAVRWVSAEPLLGPLDLSEYVRCGADWLGHSCDGCILDWVVVGGESGPGARPTRQEWVRSLRDQCVGAGVPYLFKQWGEWAPTARTSVGMARVGKNAAGRFLDGRTWDEYPAATS